ncbi:MAG: glycosyltransferase [Methanococcaceae archaeon]
MKIVIFGLTISSSWGNGHATIWRGLCRALIKRGHHIVFFERDVPYYSSHRDLTELPGTEIILYTDVEKMIVLANYHLYEADTAIVTSYCPDGMTASDLILKSFAGFKVFYDLDTPVTIKDLKAGKHVPYLPAAGLGEFDLVLSYTGGPALLELKNLLGARQALPLYGSADPDYHKPAALEEVYRSDFSYLGTYAEDRQDELLDLFIEPAKLLRGKKFLIGGSLYPPNFPWSENIYFIDHVAPPEHSKFYSSSGFTLNITRGAMAAMGYCPSGRLFEAALCEVPVISDYFKGLENFFELDKEIIIVQSTGEVVKALNLSPASRKEIAQNARQRVLKEHTSWHRAVEFENIINSLKKVANKEIK